MCRARSTVALITPVPARSDKVVTLADTEPSPRSLVRSGFIRVWASNLGSKPIPEPPDVPWPLDDPPSGRLERLPERLMIEVIKEEQRFRPVSPIQTEAPAGPEIAIVNNEMPSVVAIEDTIVVPGDDPKRRPIDNQRTVIDQRTALSPPKRPAGPKCRSAETAKAVYRLSWREQHPDMEVREMAIGRLNSITDRNSPQAPPSS